jgi:branched-chain amino acid transport system substrate-binding protein
MKIFPLTSVFLATLVIALPVSAEPIKIGVQTSLSGDVATAGEDVKNGILFAAEELGKDKYQIIIEDDRCAAPQAVKAASKLTSVDNVKYVLGPVCNGALLPVAPIYDRAGVTLISAWATSGDVHDIGKRAFRLFPSDELTAKKLYDYLASRHKKIALLTELEEYTALIDRSLKKFAKADTKGVTFLDEEVTVGSLDYRSVLTKMLSQKPEAIILNAYSEPTLGAMAKQVRQMNKDIPLYALYYPASESFRHEYSEVLEGVLFVDAPEATALLTAGGKKLAEKFKERYGPPKSSPYLWAIGYESLRALNEAIESKEDPAQYLHSHKLQGGPLPPYSFNSFGESEDIKVQIKKVVNGEVVVVE